MITKKLTGVILFFALGILFLLGTYAYYNNYKQQKESYYKLKYQESQLNELNTIYISLLKASRDARGFRIYQIQQLKNDYLRYKNEVITFLNAYQLSESDQDSTGYFYFIRLKQSILNRLQNLDSTINQPTVRYNDKTGLLEPVKRDDTTEQTVKELEAAYQSIITYWSDVSKESFDSYHQQGYSNDTIFLISILLILTITVLWVISSAQFIRQQHFLNQELVNKNVQIEATRNELEDFAYILSHDLKAPLRSIKGLLGIIKKKGDNMEDAKKNEYFNVVINSAEYMNQMIDNLLEYSRTGSVQEKMQEVAVTDIFKTQILFFDEDINSLKGRIQTESTVKTVLVYPVLFQRLMTNLISNAIKYHSELPPVIQIKCLEEDEYILFSIKDNGIGIPESEYETIFKLFKSLKPNKDSNGIGLSVCKKIVENHGGKIWVESKVDEGTTFYFTISKKLSQI